jgi:ADP-ribosylglycohydrolase
MTLRPAQLQDRYRAAVLGFAIGDALGFPLRGLPPPSSAQASILVDDFAPRPRGGFAKGQFSDDTQMMMAAAGAVARERRIDGKAVAEHLSSLWQEGTILQAPISATQAAHAILDGTPWMSAGARLGVCDPSSLSRGVVAGLTSSASPARLAHDAHLLTVVTHKDPLCAAAVAALGRAIQLGLSGETRTPQQWCERVAGSAAAISESLGQEIFYLPRTLSWDSERALSLLRRVGVSPTQYDVGAGLPPHVTPVLLTALYAFLKQPSDFRAALALVLRCGGEVDVAAGVTGAILGASGGTDFIPTRLRKNVLYGQELLDTADSLFEMKMASSTTRVTATITARR